MNLRESDTALGLTANRDRRAQQADEHSAHVVAPVGWTHRHLAGWRPALRFVSGRPTLAHQAADPDPSCAGGAPTFGPRLDGSGSLGAPAT